MSTRKPIIVLVIAAIFLAALLPSAPIVVCALLIALAVFVPAFVIARELVDERDVQRLSLRCLALLRAPPLPASLV